MKISQDITENLLKESLEAEEEQIGFVVEGQEFLHQENIQLNDDINRLKFRTRMSE